MSRSNVKTKNSLRKTKSCAVSHDTLTTDRRGCAPGGRKERARSYDNAHLKERDLDRFQLGQGSLETRQQLRCGEPAGEGGRGRRAKGARSAAHETRSHGRYRPPESSVRNDAEGDNDPM